MKSEPLDLGGQKHRQSPGGPGHRQQQEETSYQNQVMKQRLWDGRGWEWCWWGRRLSHSCLCCVTLYKAGMFKIDNIKHLPRTFLLHIFLLGPFSFISSCISVFIKNTLLLTWGMSLRSPHFGQKEASVHAVRYVWAWKKCSSTLEHFSWILGSLCLRPFRLTHLFASWPGLKVLKVLKCTPTLYFSPF